MYTLSRSSPSLTDSSSALVIVADFSFALFNESNNSLFSKIFPVALAKPFEKITEKIFFFNY